MNIGLSLYSIRMNSEGALLFTQKFSKLKAGHQLTLYVDVYSHY